MNDLWPKEIAELEVKAPSAILREQASLLAPKTQYIVEARVQQLHSSETDQFMYRFEIVAPALGDYRYALFGITHGIELYPLRFVLLDEDIEQEVLRGLESDHWTVDSEARLLERLREILGAPKTRRIISSLLAQAQLQEEEKRAAD